MISRNWILLAIFDIVVLTFFLWLILESKPPQIPIELVAALIVAAGNFFGIFLGFLRLERKIDKKIDRYEKRFDSKSAELWKKFRESEEGTALFEILDETRKMFKTSEATDLLKEATATFKEVRAIMKKFAERMETPSETTEADEEQADLLPSLKKAGRRGHKKS